jgi:Neugrin
MLSPLRAIARSTNNAVASCSHTDTARYLHSQRGHEGLRRRDWQTTPAYPAPTPLMLKDDEKPVDLSEDEDPVIPRKPQTNLKYAKRSLPDEWKRHREGLKESFPNGWSPPKTLSRAAMEGLRILHAQDPEVFTTPLLASKFRISPEAVRRILKSKWEPSRERRQKLSEKERIDVEQRWRKKQLEEAKSRIEAIAEKKDADAEESEVYWSTQDPEKRIKAERRNRRNRRNHRPSFGSQSFGLLQRPASPKKDLFFS